MLGLVNIGVHLVRVETGHDSTQFHFHHQDEDEFIYILSGKGIAEIGDEDDLVYLMGGSRSDIDIFDYPKLSRRMFRVDGVKTYVSLDQIMDVDS